MPLHSEIHFHLWYNLFMKYEQDYITQPRHAVAELDLLYQLHRHRMLAHGSPDNDIVLCETCAMLEGKLEQLIRFLDTPTGKEIH